MNPSIRITVMTPIYCMDWHGLREMINPERGSPNFRPPSLNSVSVQKGAPGGAKRGSVSRRGRASSAAEPGLSFKVVRRFLVLWV